MSGADAGPVVRVPAHIRKARLESQFAEWRDWAECRKPDVQHVDFGPERESEAWPAIAVCRQCPVQAECLEDAIAGDERHGVWGGKTERERQELVRGKRTRRSGQ